MAGFVSGADLNFTGILFFRRTHFFRKPIPQSPDFRGILRAGTINQIVSSLSFQFVLWKRYNQPARNCIICNQNTAPPVPHRDVR